MAEAEVAVSESGLLSARDGEPRKVKEKLSVSKQAGGLPEYFTCSLYDSKAKTLMKGLTLASCQPNIKAEDFQPGESNDEQSSTEHTASPKKHVISDKMACSTCDCQFTSRTEQRKHYKLDWHRFNLRQKAAGQPSVTEEAFESMLTGEISSISGSDSSSSDSEDEENQDLSPISKPHKIRASFPSRLKSSPNSGTDSETDDDGKLKQSRGRQYPKLYFKNSSGQILSIYRCIIYGKKNVPVTQNELIYKTETLTQQMKWCVLMVAGGHFAGAIFDGEKVLLHKTFHRYTVRAKRGSAQGIRDSQQGGHAPRSAGASLRRYNEAALIQDIHDLLDDWKESLADCDHIFLRAPSFNKAIFFSGKNAHFSKKDPRFITIPFSTRRPTFAEVKRVHAELMTAECYGNEEDVADLLPWSPKPKAIPRRLSKQKVMVRENGENGNGRGNNGRIASVLATEDGRHSEVKQGVVKDPQKFHKDSCPKDGGGEISSVTDRNNRDTTSKDGRGERSPEKETKTDEVKGILDSETPNESMEQLESDSDNETNAEDSLAVETVETETSTLHLREFENLRNKPKRKKKPGVQKKEKSVVEEENRPGSALYQLRNDLYTACKTGDEDMMMSLLKTMSETGKADNYSLTTVEDTTNKITDTEIDVALETGTVTRTDTDDSAVKEATSENMETSENETQQSSQPGDEKIPQQNDQTSIGSGADAGKDVVSLPSMERAEILNDSFASDGRTLLHIAAKAGQRKIIRILLESGADPAIRDKNGKCSYALSIDKPTRNEFRKFMADYPDMYDYTKAQIPSPLTTEMESEKAVKMAEKRKEKKKARKDKLKEQKAEDKKKKDEEKEKQWFASLSEREKRALAAERRLAQQLDDKNTKRCWLCGENLADKVPFEYMDFKFCSIKCLKEHKQQQQQQQTQSTGQRR
ncbi:tRNA endonuclease ANKZF1-like [Ptychodera flava]|uniref:tRNA endonuclease ANKZF1-like n=1 Tax=Ptychodera flava TaxID=63121 RepID=UPI00396A7A7C